MGKKGGGKGKKGKSSSNSNSTADLVPTMKSIELFGMFLLGFLVVGFLLWIIKKGCKKTQKNQLTNQIIGSVLIGFPLAFLIHHFFWGKNKNIEIISSSKTLAIQTPQTTSTFLQPQQNSSIELTQQQQQQQQLQQLQQLQQQQQIQQQQQQQLQQQKQQSLSDETEIQKTILDLQKQNKLLADQQSLLLNLLSTQK